MANGNIKKAALKELARRELAQRQSQQKVPFLPKTQQVEQRIGQREASLKPQLPQLPFGKFGNNPLTLPARSVGGGAQFLGNLFRRGEAGIANPALQIQKQGLQRPPLSFGSFSPLTGALGIARESGLLEPGRKGLTGERLGELGDPVRTTGFGGPLNEFFASFAGLFSSIGLTNIATKGKLFEGAKKIKSAIKEGRKLTRDKQLDFFINKGDELQQGADDVLTGIRQEFDILDDKIKDFQLDQASRIEVQDIAVKLPKKILDNLTKRAAVFKSKAPLGEKFRKVLSPNVDTANAMKKEIGKAVPDRVWNGLAEATPEQMQLMQDYSVLRKIVANNVTDDVLKSELLQLNDDFSKLIKSKKVINSLTRKSVKGAIVKTGKIRKIGTPDLRGERLALDQFSKDFFPRTDEILQRIDRVNKNISRGRSISRGLGNIGKFAIGAELGRRFVFNPLLDTLSGSGGGGGGGQFGGQ